VCSFSVLESTTTSADSAASIAGLSFWQTSRSRNWRFVLWQERSPEPRHSSSRASGRHRDQEIGALFFSQERSPQPKHSSSSSLGCYSVVKVDSSFDCVALKSLVLVADLYSNAYYSMRRVVKELHTHCKQGVLYLSCRRQASRRQANPSGPVAAAAAVATLSTALCAPTAAAPSLPSLQRYEALGRYSISDAVERCANSVVNITCGRAHSAFYGPSNPLGLMGGSGFILTAEGLIVTNAHVAAARGPLIVTLATGQKFAATVQAMDEQSDVALLKVILS
jgi:Trypsin-like peptidase domain